MKVGKCFCGASIGGVNYHLQDQNVKRLREYVHDFSRLMCFQFLADCAGTIQLKLVTFSAMRRHVLTTLRRSEVYRRRAAHSFAFLCMRR